MKHIINKQTIYTCNNCHTNINKQQDELGLYWTQTIRGSHLEYRFVYAKSVGAMHLCSKCLDAVEGGIKMLRSGTLPRG